MAAQAIAKNDKIACQSLYYLVQIQYKVESTAGDTAIVAAQLRQQNMEVFA